MSAPPLCRFGFPALGFGAGLRTVHFADVLSGGATVDWFEIISENFMGTGGRPMRVLDDVASRFPVVLHGVSLGIGGTDPLDRDYLRRLKSLAARVRAPWVSDHVCWTGVAGRTSHDLLPIPYTEEALRHVVSRIRQVQDILERPLVLENPSSYAEFRTSSMSEPEFISRMAEAADCGLLLDVNNVYVSAVNHGFDPVAWIDAVPADRVVQYHLAGHTPMDGYLLDTHVGPVPEPVRALFVAAWKRIGPRAAMVEWDEQIPAFDVVRAEVERARALVAAPTGARGARRARAALAAGAAR